MKSIGFYKDWVWPHEYLTTQRAAAVKEAFLVLENITSESGRHKVSHWPVLYSQIYLI